jgi:hypothetical protein
VYENECGCIISWHLLPSLGRTVEQGEKVVIIKRENVNLQVVA